MLYDDHDLQLGDDDYEHTWGGERPTPTVATTATEQTNSLRHAAHVQELQEHLRSLGFLMGPMPNGKFDRYTSWSVREFQIYAKMEQVAQERDPNTTEEYVDNLGPVRTGSHRYGGPVSGVVNAGTRAALEHWIRHRWRCPVVLDSWSKTDPPSPTRNVWRHDEDVKGAVRAHDFSDHYSPLIPPFKPALLGTRMKYGNKHGPGNQAEYSHVGAEVLPESLIGRPWASLTTAEQSTFRVVRAVAEIECDACFDVVNGYDDAIVSIGIFHFILGHSLRGELVALLDRWRNENSSDFQRAVGFFGVNPQSNGAGSILSLHWDGEDKPSQLSQDDRDYLRNWHWYYRWVMLGRTFPSFRTLMWISALERISRILGARFESSDQASGSAPPDPPGSGPLGAGIGEVLTSELATAALLRWDVNLPARIRISKSFRKGNRRVAGPALDKILEEAKSAHPSLDWDINVARWTQAHEDALIDAIFSAAQDPKLKSKEVARSLPRIKSFPNQNKAWHMSRGTVGPLSATRGSFHLASIATPTPSPSIPVASP